MNKKIEERIERYNTGALPEPALKKRKLSRVLVFGNIGLLVFILILFRQPNAEKAFHAELNYDNLSYTFNIKRSAKDQLPVFSASIASRAPEEREYRFKSSLGNVSLKYQDAVVYEGVFGEKIDALRLKPDELKKIILRIDESGIRDLIEENPDAVISKRKSFLFNQRQYVPLEAHIKINTIKPVTLRLDFNYEIK
jgi:hypothetical protein